MKIDVLDHGFVELIDVMGDDKAIVDAARQSYGKGTTTVSDDRALIRYLMRRGHTTPFEMVEFKFAIRLPVFVGRQLVRQRTANLNEYSGRFSIMPGLFYIPSPERVGRQSTTNKQGTGEPLSQERALAFVQWVSDTCETIYSEYEHWVDPEGDDVSRELARIALPVNIYSDWTWKLDLHNMFKLLNQRLDHHAQWEIRQYAEAIAKVVKERCPVAWEAFQDYQRQAVTFSRMEMATLRRLIKAGNFPTALIVDDLASERMGSREAREFWEKIKA